MLTTIIQHSFESPSYSSQRRKVSKSNPDWNGRSKSLIVDEPCSHKELDITEQSSMHTCIGALQCCGLAISIPISLPSWPSLAPAQVTTEHHSEFPVLCSRFPTSCLFHTRQHTYINLSLPVHPVSSLCPHIRSLHLHLYSCPANRFICTIFLDST